MFAMIAKPGHIAGSFSIAFRLSFFAFRFSPKLFGRSTTDAASTAALN
jgi:hypothetical protein